MSEFKGTPGPWTWYQPQSTPSMNLYGAAFVLGPKRVPMDRSEGFTAADAKLIASAPDLLEAIQKIQFRCECFTDDGRSMKMPSIEAINAICQEAIAKALA